MSNHENIRSRVRQAIGDDVYDGIEARLRVAVEHYAYQYPDASADELGFAYRDFRGENDD